MRHCVMDIEADALLEDVTRIWCIVLRDLETNEVLEFAEKFPEAFSIMENAETVWAHNGIAYDFRALKKVCGWAGPARERIRDSLLAARLSHPDIKTWDFAEWYPRGMPGELIGSHGLHAWGYRLNMPKTGLDVSFAEFSQELLDRCVQDTAVTAALVKRCLQVLPPKAWETECKLAWYLRDQTANGFPFDVTKAHELAASLRAKRHSVADHLISWGGSWIEQDGEPWIPKRDNRKLGYVAGCPVQKIKHVTFNPGSRHHVAKRLGEEYGWTPTEQTETGEPKVDESVLAPLKDMYPAVADLIEYYDLAKKLGYVIDGKESWLNHVRNDGPEGISVIHGEVNQLGTATGRASHRNPNLGQVPSEHEYRELFFVP